MSTYKVTVDEDESSGMEILVYLALFTILLPVGIIYLLYKFFKWIHDSRVEHAINHSGDFEQAINDLTSLHKSYKEGLINEVEYSQKKPRIIQRIRVNKCSNEKIRGRLLSIKELNEQQILLDSEYERIRVELAKMLK